MDTTTLVSPDDQNVTFVELFFDLVFVFSVTQVVALLHHGLNWATVGQAILVFWLVWWAWTQYSWALNAADTTHPIIELGTLLATAVAFFMAVALPGAFEERALWFAIPYVLVRVIGLVLYTGVTSQNPQQAAGVRRFAIVSIGGLVAVLIGGSVGGTLQYLFWGLAILLDIVAAAAAGQSEGWNIHPEHFGERYGLFVIIALGETLIVAAGSVAGASWTNILLMVAVLAVALTCGLWWSYFPRAKPILDHALKSGSEVRRSEIARDVFTLLHFPMILGIAFYAAAIGEAAVHPDIPLSLAARIGLAVGLILFVGGMAVAVWRATQRILVPRFVLIMVTAFVIVVLSDLMPFFTLAIAFVGVLLVALVEERMIPAIRDVHEQEPRIG